MPFSFEPTDLDGVICVIPRTFSDDRGAFWESYKQSEFEANGIAESFVQDNVSTSQKDVVRGLHYQLDPFAQGKLVQVLVGKVFDVAVDLRKDSPTFGKWYGVILEQRGTMLYVPPGFGHGFAVLSDHVVFNYKVTAEYAPQCERGVRWNDPDLAVDWPVANPLLSSRDEELPFLGEADIFPPASSV